MLAASATLQAADAPGVLFEHSDWELACDNTRTCRAAGYYSVSGDDDEDDASSADNGEPMPVSVLFMR